MAAPYALSPAYREIACLSEEQARVLEEAGRLGRRDPLILSDQEGAGPVADLEEAFAAVTETPYALAVSSGTAAIHGALLALGIGPGDEVLTTPYTWPQTVSPIYHVGATPVFADIDPETTLLDPKAVEAALTSRTKAILTVHLFGQIAGTEQLAALAREHGLLLIGDAAQLAPTTAAAASLSQMEYCVCFSLGRGKPVSAGEGGMIVTREEKAYEMAVAFTQHPNRYRRLFGLKSEMVTFGLNFRLHPLAALLGLAELKTMQERFAHRRSVYDAFWGGLGSVPHLRKAPDLWDARIVPYGIPATFGGTSQESLDDLCRKATENGIPVRQGPVRLPLHLVSSGSYGRSASEDPPGSRIPLCHAAERRCQQEELLVLSALDMDGLDSETAWEMGRRLAVLCASAV